MSNCAYQDCYCVRHPCSQIAFFNLPTDPKRREQWIKNSGPNNKKLQNLTEKSKRLFCEAHFDDKYLRRQFHRATLHPSAVPFKYGEENKPVNETKGKKQDQGMGGVLTMRKNEEEINETVEINHAQEIFMINVGQEDGETVQNQEDNLETPNYAEVESPIVLNKNEKSSARKRILNESANEVTTPKRVRLRELQVVDGSFVFQLNASPASNPRYYRSFFK